MSKREGWNKHIGALSEIAASRWLLANEYEVFRNVSAHGIADLVAWKPGAEVLYIDVKKFAHSEPQDGAAYVYPARPSHEQVQADVVFLYVCHETWEASFDVLDLLASRGLKLRGGVKVGGTSQAGTKGWKKGADGVFRPPLHEDAGGCNV